TNTPVYVDSSIAIVVHVKDTTGFQNVRIFFQDQFYASAFSDSMQAFMTFVQPNDLGQNTILALAEYDSLGFTVNHIDTVTLLVEAIDTLSGFYVTPGFKALNPGQQFEPAYHVIYPSFIGTLEPHIEGLSHIIGDTNVIRFDSTLIRFVAKDSGSTVIMFSYGDFADTLGVYISCPVIDHAITMCDLDTVSLDAGI